LFLKCFYRKTKISFIFLLISFLILSSFVAISKSDGLNTISIDPACQNVSTDECFIINIYCVPSEPIKAFEFALLFDASLLQAESVVKGNIFSEYSVFFNSGLIDNGKGLITQVYGFIVGDGNVTTPGVLASINFKATSNNGISNITLYDAGLTNEKNYLLTVTNNGIIAVDDINSAFGFSNTHPGNNSIDVSVDTTVLSIDIYNIDNYPFYWEIATSPFIGNSSGFNEYDGIKTCNVSDLKYGSTYHWLVRCKDIVTGEWTNKTYLFTTKIKIFAPSPPQYSELDENVAPVRPLMPIGEVFIKENILYEYSSLSYDLNNDKIRYRFDWGDGTVSGWSEYMPSNLPVSMTHSWTHSSTYKIKVVAQDPYGFNSTWSEPLEIFVFGTNGSWKGLMHAIDSANDTGAVNENLVFDILDKDISDTDTHITESLFLIALFVGLIAVIFAFSKKRNNGTPPPS